MPGSPYAAAPFISCIAAARRGIIVVGQMIRAQDAAAALKIAQALGWPLVADVLSGENSVALLFLA
jgi:2-succinyl-5-enolpyruvyl-6-hydroxy-3-cyclohexene-1-carboxylate synthase